MPAEPAKLDEMLDANPCEHRAIGPLEAMAHDFSGCTNEREAAVEGRKKMRGGERGSSRARK